MLLSREFKKNHVNNFISFFIIHRIIYCIGCFSTIVTNRIQVVLNKWHVLVYDNSSEKSPRSLVYLLIKRPTCE